MSRYKVVTGSETGHCCFESTVVDTAHPDTYGCEFQPMCECMYAADAQKICDALNAASPPSQTAEPNRVVMG